MLASLTIQDLVLIDRLEIAFDDGYSVITGETGAGKSVVLNALALVTGMRGGKDLIRRGAQKASITAIFDVANDAPVTSLLGEHDIDIEEQLVVRRTVSSEGKNRCFVNDQPVTLGFLRALGEQLVEIHGQFDAASLVGEAGQRAMLDGFGSDQDLIASVASHHRRWRELSAQCAELEHNMRRAQEDESYLRHQLDELQDMAAVEGEEDRLAAKRTALMHAEKLGSELQSVRDSVGGSDGVAAQLSRCMRQLERLMPVAEQTVEPVIACFDRLLIELGEAEQVVDDALGSVDLEPASLEAVEKRLFDLRDLARKHRVAVDELPALMERTREQLDDIDHGSSRLDELKREREAALAAYSEQASALHQQRKRAAKALQSHVEAELAPLKLERSRFRVSITVCDVEAGGAHGIDRVKFEVSMNPGQPFTSIERTASGGERSRILLALKAVIGNAGGFSTMVFDEIDTGLGGATADAVGERLARLACGTQVIVISHAPQVAARADHHFLVNKSGDNETASIQVERIEGDVRRDELARMLAGAILTDAARAAAQSLLEPAAG